MSAKNLDKHNRWRNKTVAFRVSPEEDEQLEIFVKLSGLTKQDYIIRRLLERDVVVQGNPRVYKALRDQLVAVLDELRRIEAGQGMNDELLDTIQMIATIMNGMQEDFAYVSLTPTQQASCLRCYGKMTPYVIESVLSKPEDVGSPDRSKKIGAYSFVKDDVKISRAIVVVLYMLRCCLAHGDFSPDEASNNVYKYAYEVLCAPLKKLR